MPDIISVGMKVATFFKTTGTTAKVIATIVNATVIAGTMGVFNKKAKFGKVAGTKRELQGRTLNARGSVGSRQYVYGKVKVGGQVAYMETVGDENRFLHMVLVHCAHEVEEIGDLYVNDELVPLSGTTPESGNKYNGNLVVYSYTGRSDQTASSPLVSVMGNWTNAHRLRGCAYSYFILELDREDNVWPGGIPTFTRVIKGRKSWDPRPLSITAINQSAAAQVTVVDHGLVTGDHILATSIGGMTELNGTEYYVNRLTDDTFGLYDATTLAAINSTGFTAYTSGGTITRKRYSANAAICIADYITSEFGFGRFGTDRNDIDSSDWISAANVCDDPITLNTNPWVASTYVAKGAYRNNDLSPVKTYRATTAGTSAGSGGPTGTGSSITDNEITWEYVQTATTTEPRYEINGTIQANEDPQAVLKKLRGAMAGFVEYIGGKWVIHAGAWRTATTTLTEADFASGIAGSTKDDRRSSANRVKGIFADANDKYSTVDFPAVTNSTYLTEDQGVEAWRDVEYSYTTSSSTAQRLAKINLERGRQQIKHTASFSLKAMRIQAGDNFKLTFAKYSYSAKEFVCLSHKLFMGDGGSLAVEMTFRETASSIFTWSNGEETVLDPAPNTNLPNPFSVATPTIGTIESGTDQLVSQGGIVRSRIMVPWTAGDDAHLSGHEVQWKKRNAYSVTGVSKSNPCVVTFASHNFENGETVDFYQLGGMTQLNGNSYTVANKTATTIELSGINSTSFGTWTSGGFAESTWDAAITVPMPSTVFYISDVEDGVDYDVRVRGITSVAKSSWDTVTNHTVVGKTAAPANPVSPTVSAVENGVSVQFNQHADLDFLQYQIWVQTSSSAPTHTGTGGFTPAPTTTTSDLSKTITGLDPDLTYYVFTAAQDSTRLLSNIVATSPATISPLAISADSSLGSLATLDRVNLATTSNGGVTGSLPVGNTDATNNGATVNSSGNVNGGMVVNATSGAIQSSNYATNSAGWKIDGDGNSEFNDATIRGDLEAGTVNINDNFQVSSAGAVTVGDDSAGKNYFLFQDTVDNEAARLGLYDSSGDNVGYLQAVNDWAEFKLFTGASSTAGHVNIDSQGLVHIKTNGSIDDAFNVERPIGSTSERFNIGITKTGVLEFGLSATRDTNLYRDAANVLKTDDLLKVGSGITSYGGIDIDETATAQLRMFNRSNVNDSDDYWDIRHANGGQLQFLYRDDSEAEFSHYTEFMEDGSILVQQNALRLWNYTSANSDITSLTASGSSTFGALIEGDQAAHLVLGIRGNDALDGLYVIKDETNSSGRGSYDTMLLRVDSSVGVQTGNGINLQVQGNAHANLYHSTLNDGYSYFRYGSASLVDFQLRINSGNLEYSTDATNWNTIATT